MKYHYQISDEYTDLAAEVIAERDDLHWIPSMVSICYMASDQERKKSGREVLGECILVKDLYRAFCPYDFLIVIYQPNVVGLSYNQLKILMYHELLHIGMKDSEEEPEFVVNPHDIEDFRTIINRYGIDWARKGGG